MSKTELKDFVIKAVKAAQKEGELPLFDMPEALIEFPEREEHGDYSTNIALLIGKETGREPMEAAGILLKFLRRELKKDQIEKLEAKEPGFINFWLSKEELLNSLKRILKEKDKFGSGKEGKTVVIDYSAPNIAKPFGVGHLRSTIIGQALYNIYKFLGWKCIGDNHLGDWGTQFGKLIVAIKKWNKKPLDNLTIQDLEELYVKFHQEAEEDEELLEEARQWFKKLEEKDKEAEELWQLCVRISLKEFNRVYKILGVKIDYALGESFYGDKMEEVIEDARKKGFAKESRGALVIPLPGIGTPLMLLKSDGATTYETRELATIKHRMEKWKPDLIIWEVGVDQKFHFQKSFLAAEILGYGKREQFVHVAHGLIRWAHGKFSTRKGETIHLEEILKEAIKRAEKIIEQSQTAKNISKKEKQEIARQVGIGAIKYNDLSRHYSKDVIFDWDNVFSLEGNSGPYLQYTAVRCQSVLQKAGASRELNFVPVLGQLKKEEETILRTIRRFPEIVQEVAAKFSPNLICNLAFDLAQKYNIFYEKCPILGAKTDEVKEFRLALTEATRQVLKNSLELLGISIPQKM